MSKHELTMNIYSIIYLKHCKCVLLVHANALANVNKLNLFVKC